MSLSASTRNCVRSVRLLALCGAVLAWVALIGARLAVAHEGHDHGSPVPPLGAAVKPRVSVETEAYQLVAIATGEQLTLYLDRHGTNEPLTDADIAILSGDRTIPAMRRTDGSYTATVPGTEKPGKHELLFNVSHADGNDLLVGTLDVAALPALAEPRDRGSATGRLPRMLLSAFVLLAGLSLGLAIRSRRILAATVAAVLCAALLATAATAHDGHGQSPVPEGANLLGETPRRLPDGSLFLPKPSQRLLTIRTQIAVEGEARRALSLVGRIIADPNRSGIVQSIAGGRVSPPEGGFPRLGQKVGRGEVLASVDPALPLADQSTLAEKQRDLEGAIQLLRQKHDRLARIGAPTVSRASIEDAELEIANLQQRLAGLRSAKLQPEILTAPIDGIVSASRVVAGQVVAAQDLLFQIVDPASLWVEALLFDQLGHDAITDASAIGADGTVLRLAYRGRGRALQAQAVQIQFALLDPPTNISIGLPVTVIARKSDPVRGMLLPREALVRGAAGEAIVWQQIEPERFLARQVRFEPFDGKQVLLTGGVKPRDRIVVHGAESLLQIR